MRTLMLDRYIKPGTVGPETAWVLQIGALVLVLTDGEIANLADQIEAKMPKPENDEEVSRG